MTTSCAATLTRESDHWVGRFVAMAAPCEVLIDHAPASLAQQVLDRVAAEAWRIERRFSRYRGDSAVQSINENFLDLRDVNPNSGTSGTPEADLQTQVNVIQSKELNAFCMPGGRIMFYSGLITQLDLTNDEIAIVMGHEIAHALREHSREQASQEIAAQTGLGVGAAILGVGGAGADLAAQGYQTLIATKFSRTDESEADLIGLELAARAGYDPRAGITLWKKMMQANSGNASPEFLSTHPAEANRVQTIEALLPTVMPLYQAAVARGAAS